MTITADHLSKRFRHHVAVDDVSFTVRPGFVTALLGPNGAGKTTTLRMLLGLTHPTSGRALVDGVPYAQLDRPLLTVGSQLDGAAAHPGHTARAHLRTLADTARIDRASVEHTLARLGLDQVAHRRVGVLSLGMRQRLGMAGALLADPPHLVLDEPGNGMDPEAIVWLRQLLRTLADRGCAVLLSSHQLGEVAAIADHVVVVSEGRVKADTPLASMGRSAEQIETSYLRLVHR